MRNIRQMMVAVLIALGALAQFPTAAMALVEGPGVPGCTNPAAINFNPMATVDNGSCNLIPMMPPMPPMPPMVPVSTPVGTVEVTDPTDGEELNDLYQFSGTFTNATPLTSNGITYRISSGTCTSEGGKIQAGTMFNTGGSLAVTLDLSSYEIGDYCFQVTALAANESETSVSDRVNFKVVNPSYVSIYSPYGTVNGLVGFEAGVTFGTPLLTNNIDWSVYAGDCESEGVQVAGNVGDFEDSFTYSDGQFNALLDTTNWPHGYYCFMVNPQEAGEVSDSVYAMSSFYIGFNTVSGQKYEDIDGDNRLNYEIDQLVANYPIIATNQETGQVFETTTDEEGTYTFALPNGVWTISEGEERGWDQIRAYQGWVLIDEGEEESEVVPLDCTIYVGVRGEVKMEFGRGKGDGCTFLNERGSDSSGGGTRVRAASAPSAQVLGAATSTVATCEGMYLTSYLREGQQNPADQVTRLQVFLNAFGFTTGVTGTFDAATTQAVRDFQTKYLTQVLRPWNITVGTGYVYKTTRATINNIVCPGSEAIPTI